MFCYKCGKEIAGDSLFCSYCGAGQPGIDAPAEPANRDVHPAEPDQSPSPEAHTPGPRERIINNLILIFILLLIVAFCYALSGNFIFEGLGTVINKLILFL